LPLIVAFNLLQLAVSGHALLRGGGPERTVALLLLVAAGATLATPMVPGVSYFTLFVAVLWIDLALFVALAAVSAVANRFWPIWMAALQLFAIATHLARAYDPSFWAAAYWLVTTKTAYPMLLLLYIGTVRHRRRLALGLPERSWSWSPRGDDPAQNSEADPL
jgi:hypothetical protein